MSKRILGVIALIGVRLTAATLTNAQRQTIDKIIGSAGTYSQFEDVQKFSFPRSDARVTVDGTPFHPFMGLMSWAAFTAGARSVTVMGDMALFEDEVSPAMSAAL